MSDYPHAPVSAVVCLGAKVDQEPPHEVGEGVGAEQDGVRDVGQNIDQEVLSWVTVVRRQGDRGRPLVVDLKYVMAIKWDNLFSIFSIFTTTTRPLTTRARSKKRLAIKAHLVDILIH